MDRRIFAILCNMLRTTSHLAPPQCVNVQEMVAIFFYILAHDVKNLVGRQFAQSGETVSRHFTSVLTTVLQLHELLLKKSKPISSDCIDKLSGYIGWHIYQSQWSAADSRLLRDAISQPHGVKVPKGYYYLCDVGYPNVEGILAPYRGERYNLSEWRGAGNALTNPRESFNMKHLPLETA
ncbi:uncharacterized protein LOC120076038 [Benincasa hispida]|uniref:uncharacterized protein LOC120076038 n=1 Tax=Benincasa hispida TaxID=102211 RepID=UPI0019023A72|nr:uncharacterized protein LOC120076038 [Benincasa hispida]